MPADAAGTEAARACAAMVTGISFVFSWFPQTPFGNTANAEETQAALNEGGSGVSVI